MYFTIYKITNTVSGKIYVGSHKTKNLNDGYMGSGKHLKYAQRKYGIENFIKEILFVFNTPKEMYDKEAELVNEEFINSNDTYNMKLGGFGGFDHINSNEEFRIEKNKKARFATNKKHEDKLKDWSSKGGKIRYQKHGRGDAFINAGKSSFAGKNHSVETKTIIGEKNSISQLGERNSQYGTRWIHCESLKQSKKISKTDLLPEGWFEGRKIKF